MRLKTWRRIHSWTSLICTAFLLLLCLTGLPLIFHDELDFALRPKAAAPRVVSTVRGLGVDQILAIAAKRLPGRFVQFIYWEKEADDLLGVGVASTPDASLENVTRLLFDRRTGGLVDERPPENRVLQGLLDLHGNLLLGTAGTVVVAGVALCFLASLISGIVLYGPSMRSLEFGGIRWDRSRRLLWLDLHNLLGIAVAAWMLVVGVTGLINTLEGALFARAQGAQMERLLRPYQGKLYPKILSSPEAAVEKARRALPGMTPTSLGFPYSRFGSPRHYLIWLKGTSPLTARLFHTVLIDAETGGVADATPFPWYVRAVELSRPLHFGDYGGLPLKLLWAAFDLATIAVLLTGLRHWWRALESRRGDGGPRAAVSTP